MRFSTNAVGERLSQTSRRKPHQFKKVLIKLFQKFAGARGRALVASAEAKLSYSLSFCELFLWAYCLQRKSGRTITVNFTPLTAAPLSAACYTFVLSEGLCPRDRISETLVRTHPAKPFRERAWIPKAFIRLTKPLPWERWHAQA